MLQPASYLSRRIEPQPKTLLHHTWTAFTAAVLIFLQQSASAQSPTDHQVETAFLYNFAKFVDWPAGAMAKTARLCIIGDDPISSDVRTLAGRAIGDRLIEVRNVASPAEIVTCQMLFISQSEAPNLKRTLDATRGGSVLTVGDTDGFAEQGVVINFYLDEQKVRFEVNVEAAKRAKLTISSQLLRLARIVTDHGETK